MRKKLEGSNVQEDMYKTKACMRSKTKSEGSTMYTEITNAKVHDQSID